MCLLDYHLNSLLPFLPSLQRMLTKLKCAQSQFSTSSLPLPTTSLEECLKHLKKTVFFSKWFDQFHDSKIFLFWPYLKQSLYELRIESRRKVSRNLFSFPIIIFSISPPLYFYSSGVLYMKHQKKTE